MPKSLTFAWGKVVQSVWDERWLNVDGRPHVRGNILPASIAAVYNHNLMPVSAPRFPHSYPHVFLARFYLLVGVFSPLSTVPITITTILKKKER